MQFLQVIFIYMCGYFLVSNGFGAKIDVTLSPYNAAADAVSDDTREIQTAIESLNPGDTLYFPANGNFKISAPLLLYKSDIVIQFDTNAQIFADPESQKSGYDRAKHNCLFYSVSQSKITFLNMVLDGNNIPSTGVYMWQCSDIIFKNTVIRNMKGDDNRWSNGLDLRRCHNVNITNCRIDNISNTNKSATGIMLESDPNANDSTDICTNILIRNCQFKDIKSRDDADGIKFVGRLKKPLYSKSVVENCTFINCYKRAIKIQTNGILVLNNTIENNRTSDEKGEQLIDIQGVDSVQIIGNKITFNGRNPAAIGFIVRNKNILIKDNQIIFDGDSVGNNQPNYGIYSKCWMSDNPMEPPFWGENILIKNIDISTQHSGELDYGIFLYTTGGGGKNWRIDSVNSKNSSLGILAGFEDVRITHSNFSKIVDLTRQWDFKQTTDKRINTQFYQDNKEICDQVSYYGYTGILNNAENSDRWNDPGIYFNGTTDYIDFHSGNLWLLENKTMMLWLKLDEQAVRLADSNPLYPGIFAYSATGAAKNYITFDKNSADGYYHLLYSDEKSQIRRSDMFDYQAGEWIHMAIVMSNDSIPTFYINGEHKGSREKSARVKLNYLGMGVQSSVRNGAFSGTMDELKILNKVLPADSISTYYDTQKFKYLKSEGKAD